MVLYNIKDILREINNVIINMFIYDIKKKLKKIKERMLMSKNK